jgi:hypothetical protein
MWAGILTEKLTNFSAGQKNYPHHTEPDGTYITGFTRSCHLSQIEPLHDVPLYICHKHRYLLLFSHLHLALPNELFTSDFHVPSNHICHKYRYLLLFSHLHLALPSGLFTSDFPIKNLYAFFLSLISATCPSHFILFRLITE